MKKVLGLLVLVVAMLSLASCDVVKDFYESVIPPMNAGDLATRINDRMDELDSYKAEMNGTMKVYIGGTEMVSELSGVSIEMQGNSEDYYYYDYSKVITKVKSLGYEEVSEEITAYNNGKAYVMTSDSEYNYAFFSVTEKERFISTLLSDDKEIDNFSTSGNKTFAKNDDGSWVLDFSKFSKGEVDKFSSRMGIDDIAGISVKDLNVKIKASAEYLVSEISIEFVFNTEASISRYTPELVLVIKYGDFNSANKEVIKENEYTSVGDVAVLKQLSKKLDEVYHNDDGYLYLSVQQTVVPGSSSNNFTETDKIKYGAEEGKFHFEIDSTIKNNKSDKQFNQDCIVTCRDGEMLVKPVLGSIQSYTKSEQEAKKYIKSLINPTNYDIKYVTEVNKISDDVYIIALSADESLYQSALVNYDISSRYKVSSVYQIITVKTDDDGVVSMESELEVTTVDGPKLTIKSELIFDYAEEETK